MEAASLRCGTFDILHAADQDCTQQSGRDLVLSMLEGTRRGGLVWLAPPCSSWIFLSRSKSQRTKQRPQGNHLDPWVKHHNCIADFVATVLMRCQELGLDYVIEQPSSSLLYDYPPIKHAVTVSAGRRVHLTLGSYGAESLKPLVLVGTTPWVEDLRPHSRKRSCSSVLTIRDASGRVTGRPEALLASAAYPAAFCERIASLFLLHRD